MVRVRVGVRDRGVVLLCAQLCSLRTLSLCGCMLRNLQMRFDGEAEHAQA